MICWTFLKSVLESISILLIPRGFFLERSTTIPKFLTLRGSIAVPVALILAYINIAKKEIG
jgi:hypothetical protein